MSPCKEQFEYFAMKCQQVQPADQVKSLLLVPFL